MKNDEQQIQNIQLMVQELIQKKQKIKQKCRQQNTQFKQWASKRQWYMFHHSHYDWWAYPIDNPSQAYGDEYKIDLQMIQQLTKDSQFINALRSNAILGCQAWGWDVVKGCYIQKPEKDQRWRKWPIRLSKMCRSLQIFKQDDLCKNAIQYGINILKTQKNFSYAGQDLTRYFYKKHQQYNSQNTFNQIQQKQSNQSLTKIMWNLFCCCCPRL